MQFEQAERHEAMKEAHDDEDVKAVVENFMAAPSKSMTWLLAVTLNSDLHPGDAAVARLMLQAPVKMKHADTARAMVEAALRIGNRFMYDVDGRSCRRGAILEAISEQLCQRRSEAVDTEQYVGPLPGFRKNRSRPMDVLVKEDRLEIYECKMRVLDLLDEHMAEFDAIATLAESEGRPLRLGVLSLQEEHIVRDALEDLTFACDLRIASRSDIARLCDGAAEAAARRTAA